MKNAPIHIGIVAVALITLYPLLFVGFTTRDDSGFYLLYLSEREILPIIWRDLESSFTRPLHRILLGVPYLVDNFAWFKSMQIIGICAAASAGALLAREINREVYPLFPLLYLALLQNSWGHNILTSYPFMFHAAIALILASLHLFILSIRQKRRAYYALSIVLFAIPVFTYEMHVIYYLLFPLAAYCYSGRLGTALRLQAPYLLLVLALIALDLWFRLYGNRGYAGSTLDLSNLTDILRAVLFYSSSAMPGFMTLFYDAYIDIYTRNLPAPGRGTYFADISLLWVIGATLAGAICYVVLARATIKPNRSVFIGMLVATAFVFLPNLPIALTAKYQSWAKNFDFHYVTTHYAYIAMIVLLILCCVFVMGQGEHGRRTRAAVIATLVSVVTFFTSVTNSHVYATQYYSTFRFDCIDAVIASPEFSRLEDRAVIYAPTLWENDYGIMTSPQNYWDRYVRIKTGKNIRISDDAKHAGESLLEFTILPVTKSHECKLTPKDMR